MPSTYFVADSSRICGDLCGFIEEFGRFHLDVSRELIKINGKGILTEGCGSRDEIVATAVVFISTQ